MKIDLQQALAWAQRQKYPFTLDHLCRSVFGAGVDSLPMIAREGIRNALHDLGWHEVPRRQCTVFERPLADALAARAHA